ncbi:MAG: hypothetical protein WC479_07520 [Candidatus Izemoplasmatales bacterium]|jgi:hypothetical protein
MSGYSFEDDLFGEGLLSPKPTAIKAKKQNPLVMTWKQLYQEVYCVEFDRMDEPNLFNACVELNRFCSNNHLDFSSYVRWGMENFEVFSPRRMMSKSIFGAYKNNLIPEGVSGGFLVIETGQVVYTVFQKDGQIALDIPPDGGVYIEGKLVHVTRV